MRVSCRNLPNYTAKREPTCGCFGCWRKWAESGRLTAARECIDATLIAGTEDNLWATGILCYTEAARNFVNSHACAVGHWQHDTFWIKLSRFSDLANVTMDMVKAGLKVE